MADAQPTLTIRVGSSKIYATLDDGAGNRRDVATLPRSTGSEHTLQLAEMEPKFRIHSIPLRKAPARSIDLNAKDAIAKINAGDELDLEGEERTTVLAAAKSAQEIREADTIV